MYFVQILVKNSIALFYSTAKYYFGQDEKFSRKVNPNTYSVYGKRTVPSLVYQLYCTDEYIDIMRLPYNAGFQNACVRKRKLIN